jgi:hypothetical protein
MNQIALYFVLFCFQLEDADVHSESMEAHLGAMCAHTGAVEAHPGAVRILENRLGPVEAHNGR